MKKTKLHQKKANTQVICQHAHECSGCPLIDHSYLEQLKIKKEKILQAFVDEGFEGRAIKRVLADCEASPKTLGYRNKAKLVFQKQSKDKNAKLHLGIYRQGTHEVVDIPHCAVHAPLINEVANFIKGELLKLNIPVADESDLSKAGLRYLILRYSFRDKKILCVFVSTKKTVPNLAKLIEGLKQSFPEKIVALVQNINSDAGNVLLGEANRFLFKQGELSEQMGALRVSVGPLSFLQVNSVQATRMYKRVKDLLGKGPYRQGLDLYGGLGIMAMHLSSSTEKILSVEEVGPAALEGVTVARRNKIHNVLQLCADALEGVLTFQKEWGRPDWILINPPRKGCHPDVLQALLQKPPKKIVYVSCGPESLARDLMFLTQAAPYKIKSLEPFDMFPQTAHVETLAYLELSSAPRTRKAPKTTVRQTRRPRGSKTLH